MSTLPSNGSPNPGLFFETINAYQRTASLKAAIDLELFTAIGEGRATPPEIAKRCDASERGARILCDYLTVLGFLTKEGSRYRLTPDSAVFLDRRSPAYVGGATEFLLSSMLTSAFQDLAAVVRKGGTVISEDGTMTPDHPVWVKFARGMAPLMAMPAELMAQAVLNGANQKMKVLDIAAGHGLFGIAMAKRNPAAEVVALDWPAVLEVARENARAAGIDGNYSTLGGSAFEVDYGNGYDLVLLTNFLHHFDPPTCETLLRKVHAALKPGGRAVTLEFVPNDDRVSPPVPATFSMAMLGSTASGDAYTFAEFDRMFHNAGFSRSEIRELPAGFQKVILSYK